MGNRRCQACGQFANADHRCAANMTPPAPPPKAPSAVNEENARPNVEERVARASHVALYHQLHQLRRHALLPFTRPPGGLTGGEAADMAYDELKRYTNSFAGRNHPTWQDAWNTLTGATPDHPGRLRVKIDTCRTCKGRGYSMTGSSISRSLSRGLPAGTCPDCRGTRHHQETFTILASYIPPPAAS